MKRSELRSWLREWDEGKYDFTAALPGSYTTPQTPDGQKDHPWKLEPINRLEEGEIRSFRKSYPVFAVVLCLIMIGFLLLTVAKLPTYGSADSPAHNEVMERYVEKGMEETGAVNVVAGVILDYRAFDTLGESHVLYTAATAVFILLLSLRGGTEPEREKKIMQSDPLLKSTARIIVPLVIVYGIYVIFNGHLGPGGGFSGGAVMGAGLILYLNAFGFAKTEKFFTAKTYKVMSFAALACYSLAKSYSFYTGANHIESVIPLGTPGAILSSGLILILNICVGVVVAGTMYTFYCMFRKGGH